MQDNQEYGKSTLTNKILEKQIANTGDISKKNKRGKNTTTDVTLYEIEKNTYLLDTPGFQTIDIYEIETKNLEKCFKEFNKHIQECEFIGCTHIKEKNCGIKKALEKRRNTKIKIRKLYKNI